MTDEEILIIIRARDEFSQAAKATRSGLADLTEEIERLGGAERALAKGRSSLLRWHNILASETRKSEAQVSALNKRLNELHGTQLEFAGFKGLQGPQLGPIDPTPLFAGMQQYARDAAAAVVPTKELAAVQKKVAVAQKEVAQTAQHAGLHVGALGIRTEFTGFQMLRFAAALGGVQLGISVLATTVIGLRNVIINTNAQIETATLQFKTLTGSAQVAQERVADLIEFAKRTPFETGTIIEAARVLRVFGGEALDNNKTLRLIGDTAAATGADLQNLTFWISRAYAALQNGQPFGEAATRLQELAVLTPEARLEIERLSEQGQNAQAFEVLMSSLTRFSGALEEQAETWQGSTSTALDASRLLLAEGFKPLFDGLKELIANYGGATESSNELTNALSLLSQALVDILRPLIQEISRTVAAFRALPEPVKLLTTAFLVVVTTGPLVVSTLQAITAAIAAQTAVLLANPWALTAVAIGTGLVVAMRLLYRETSKANEALFDQSKALREIQDLSAQDLADQLNAAIRVLDRAIAERARVVERIRRDVIVSTIPIEEIQIFKDAQQAVDDAAAAVEDFTSKIAYRNELLAKGAHAIQNEIDELNLQRDAFLAVRDSLDEINVKIETHQELTDAEVAAYNAVVVALAEVDDELTKAEAELAFVNSVVDEAADSFLNFADRVREASDALLGLSVGGIAKGLAVELEVLNERFRQGTISTEEFVAATDQLFEGALFQADRARDIQETAKALEEFITAITGLGAKEERAVGGRAAPTAIQLLLEALQELADRGGPAIDEARQKLEQFRRIAQESGDVLAVTLIDGFFKLEFSISEANTALGILAARLGDLPELPDLEKIFDATRTAAIQDIDLLGGLLETALKRQAQARLDAVISGQQAERDALESLQRDAVAIIEGAQVDMSAAVHAGTQSRLRAIIAEAEALRNTIGAEIANIQRQLDELSARDFAQDLEIIDRQLKLAFDPREAQKLLDQRQQVVRRHEQQQLRDRQQELEQQLRDQQSALVDEFKAILDERTEVLDRAEQVARDAFEASTDEFKLQSEVRTLLMEGEVDEMARLLNEFVPEWRSAGLSYGQQLIEGIRASGLLGFISGIFSTVGVVKQQPAKLSEAQIAHEQLLGIQAAKALGANSPAVQSLRDALIEIGVVPAFREGGFARSPSLAVIGDRPGGEFVFGSDQLRQVIREEAGEINVKVFIGNREITDIVRVEIARENEFQLGRGARLAGGRT